MSDDLLTLLKQAIADGLKGESLTSCSRWASHRRVMGGEFPGPYGWKYHPWVRDMLDSQASHNYAMKAAQLGITEVGVNRAFYAIDQLKRKVLYVLPTKGNAGDFSKDRFDSALQLSPTLMSLFTDTNNVGLKKAGNVSLYIRGSRGDGNLKGLDVSELILDEVDEMDQKQIWLALTRLDGQLRKCFWAISTPTIFNKGIHKLYQTSTQEHFRFKCPSCSKRTELVWPDCVEIIGETVNDPRCAESFLKCKECKKRIEHRDKPDWLAKTGRWEVTAPNNNPDKRGFYINQLYSFTVSPGELVESYHRGMGDEAAAKEFFNSKLGMPWQGERAQVTDDMLDQCIGNHTTNDPRPIVGGRGRIITLGVDQGKWSYWTAVEWFVDQLSRDINVAAKGKVLCHGKFHEDQWETLDSLMREWQVLACVIDADPQINEARRFAKKFPGYVFLCRYRRGKTAKEISQDNKGDNKDAPMLTVDRTNWLTATLGRFRTQRIVLPRDVSLEYREHMKALVRTYEKDEQNNPVATFVDTAPDHYAHSLNYAEIALPLAASITSGQDVEKFL